MDSLDVAMEKPHPIGIFWDLENCQIPSGCPPNGVVRALRAEFGSGCSESEFVAVCDVTKQKPEALNVLNNAQVTIVHVSSTAKNAADEKLKAALRKFGHLHSPPATAVLVSGDVNFAPELVDLRYRCGFRIGLVHSGHLATEALLDCAHRCLALPALLAAHVPKKVQPKPAHPIATSRCLEVSNLPGHVAGARLRARLHQLSSNCGGKVVCLRHFPTHSAVLKFPSPQDADRAVVRLHMEDAYGFKIQARKCPEMGSPVRARKPQPLRNVQKRERWPSTSSGIGPDGESSRDGDLSPACLEDEDVKVETPDTPASSKDRRDLSRAANWAGFVQAYVSDRFNFKPVQYAQDVRRPGRNPPPPSPCLSQGSVGPVAVSRGVEPEAALLSIRIENLDPQIEDGEIERRLRDACLEFTEEVNIVVRSSGSRKGVDCQFTSDWDDRRILNTIMREEIGRFPLRAFIRSSSPVTREPSSTRSTPRRRNRLAIHFHLL